MGTSSNFGNMFSAAAASAVLTFLPMLPSQILLNNLLYDSSQLAIPTDRVDEEQLHAPSHWNIAFIRRFMLTFGPISSLFDFMTFGLMLGVLHHLMIGSRIPLREICRLAAELTTGTLIIEFITPTDGKFQLLCCGREALFEKVTKQYFESVCCESFEIDQQLQLPGGTRWIYCLSKKR